MFTAISHARPRKKWSRLNLGLLSTISRCGIFTDDALQNPANANANAIQNRSEKFPVAEYMYIHIDGATAMARLLLNP